MDVNAPGLFDLPERERPGTANRALRGRNRETWARTATAEVTVIDSGALHEAVAQAAGNAVTIRLRANPDVQDTEPGSCDVTSTCPGRQVVPGIERSGANGSAARPGDREASGDQPCRIRVGLGSKPTQFVDVSRAGSSHGDPATGRPGWGLKGAAACSAERSVCDTEGSSGSLGREGWVWSQERV